MSVLDRIHDYLRFGSVLGLSRMEELLRRLGDPHKGMRVIHVAGTNGKGSICRYVYDMLREADYRVGLYTSPYLEVFHERIERNAQYITDEELERYGSQVLDEADKMAEEGLEPPTEFEVVTAIAFLYFKKTGCDFVILEVGLGGTGDSTNVVEAPLCSVIASISMDHMDRLGNTIPEIAAEKAGIIKNGCPVISAAENPEAKAVLRKTATDRKAPFFDATLIETSVSSLSVDGCYFDAEILGKNYIGIQISMAGEHQVKNAVAALYVITLLNQQGKVYVTDEQIRRGIQKARQIGRFEVLGQDPYVVIDGAHNEDGARSLEETVKSRFDGMKILMLTGMLADKDVSGILDHFCRITDRFIVTQPDNPRAMTAEELSARIRERGCETETFECPEEAVERALSQKDRYDVILAAGSLYLIGKIRRQIIDKVRI